MSDDDVTQEIELQVDALTPTNLSRATPRTNTLPDDSGRCLTSTNPWLLTH